MLLVELVVPQEQQELLVLQVMEEKVKKVVPQVHQVQVVLQVQLEMEVKAI